jgi:hypothetical protein
MTGLNYPLTGCYPSSALNSYWKSPPQEFKHTNHCAGRTPQPQTKPATVNRERACFTTIFNKAIANRKAEQNPAAGVTRLKDYENYQPQNHVGFQAI